MRSRTQHLVLLTRRIATTPVVSTSEAAHLRYQGIQASKALRQPAWQGSRTYWTDSKGYQHFEGRGSSFSYGPQVRAMLAGAATAFGLYWWACREEVPYTHRRHSILFVTHSQERSLGRMVFDTQVAQAQQSGQLYPPEHPYSRLVTRVGQRVAKVAGDKAGGGNVGHMQNMEWQYVVVHSSLPNAFVVPGGKVVVFSGLIDLLGGNEDQLAAVLAHETAHVLARHHAERMSTLNLWAMAKLAFYLLLGLPLPDAALHLGVFLPYSRRAENEADAIGLRLMARACYDPGAAPAMLARLNAKEKQMEERSGAWVPAMLRTHPLTEERVDLVRQQMPEAYRLYEESGCGARRQAFFQDWTLLAVE